MPTHCGLPIISDASAAVEGVDYIIQLFCGFDVEQLRDLAGIAHQLLGASVEHPQRGIASFGHVIYHHIWDRQTTIRLHVYQKRNGSIEEEESWKLRHTSVAG